ncbi:MAG: ATP-binding protein [Candidatus Methanoperedens sp.]|nr:ATP-binding protein [Candidatus Methanoperedens sp.]
MENIEKSKLKALSDIASIDISLEFNDILHKILEITCEGTGAKSGTIMLVDELDNNIRMVASYGLPQNYIERVYEAAKKAGVEISSSPSGTVLETGKYYLVPNTFEEPKNKPFNDLPRELGFSSMIYTPMKKGLKVIGLLNAYWADPRQFTDEEINFVSIAASQASSVVQNARLCGRLKHNVRELKQYKENLEDKIKETHKKLYDSERYLRTIIESSFDGILVVDEEGRFEFGNDSAFNILGWPREELIGQFFIKVFPVDMEKFMLDRWHDIQNGNETPYETNIITKSDEIKYLYVSHSQGVIKGKRKYIVVIKNVTENKKLEKKIKEYNEKLEKSNEELKEADNIKTEFISNITHELMTPLTSIKGFVELLDDEAIGTINEEQKKSLGIIHRNSERLIYLIKELLAASYLEKDKLGLHFGLVSINDILSKCILDIQPLAKEKQISLFKDTIPLPAIWGDEDRLTQVIINLLGNAIKFTLQDGKITVISRDLPEKIKISIRDTGIGIPGDQLSRIFERFYQIDGSSKRKYGGTGIGLSICKNIIEKHYGSIWAESDGNGSTFHILLPKLTSGNGVRNVSPGS